MADDELYNELFGNIDVDGGATLAQDENDENILKEMFSQEDGKKKKRVMKPGLKFNEVTLTGPKGIIAFNEKFAKYKPPEKCNPYDELGKVLKGAEHWAHILFPKMKFEDVVSRCELLGERRAVKVFMTKLRLGMLFEEPDAATEDKSPERDEDRDMSPLPPLQRSPMSESPKSPSLQKAAAPDVGMDGDDVWDEPNEDDFAAAEADSLMDDFDL